jgi:hypothetical protein
VIGDETIGGGRSLAPDRQAVTLADVGGLPVWTTEPRAGARLDHAALVPEELGPDETLRSRIVPGRFFGLLPLVAFVRSLDRADVWHRPPVRASFLMDDPNLHSLRYGYIDFERLAKDGASTGFHLSVATIPLDGWFVSERAAHIFKTHPDRLSLLIHGNNHSRRELADGRGQKRRLEMIAQALRRVRRFEARWGISVASVMTAPHGECSEEVAWDMTRLGLESLCITRPFPWLDRPPSGMPLAGWFPADSSTPMPVIERLPLSRRPEEIPLRAFLGQPIVLYGHHWDVGLQPGLLAGWAEHVARLHEVSWAPMGAISRGLVSWRSQDETLWVRPHTRLVDIEAPAGISRLVVDGGGAGYEMAVVSDGTGVETAVALSDRAGVPVSDSPTRLTIRMESQQVVNPNEIANPRWSPWPMTRRLLSEARDRTRPWTDAWWGR